MISLIIGLFIGGFLGILYTSILALSGNEPKCLGKKDISVSLRSEAPLEEKYHGVS